jgi:predicted  nucleic acid-binding Zn-ribbon protein
LTSRDDEALAILIAEHERAIRDANVQLARALKALRGAMNEGERTYFRAKIAQFERLAEEARSKAVHLRQAIAKASS